MEDYIGQLVTDTYHAARVWNISCTDINVAPEIDKFGMHVLHTILDESKVSVEILFISADLVVVTGVDNEHIPSNLVMEQLIATFGRVIVRVPYNFQESKCQSSRIWKIYAFPKQGVKYLFMK